MFITAKITFIFTSLSTVMTVYDLHIFTVIYSELQRFILEPTQWPAPCWLVSSVGRALHQYHRGHGFKSRTGLNFFRPSFHYCLSSVHNCEDHFHIHVFICSSNIWLSYIHNRMHWLAWLQFHEKRKNSWWLLWQVNCFWTMGTLDPRSDDDINDDVSSLCVEIIDKNRSYYNCMICGWKLSRKQRLKTPTLSKLGCCADRFVDQFQLDMTQATIRAIKSGDSMLKASLRVQLFGKKRNLNGNLKAITTQMKNVGLTFSILNPSLSC